MPLASIRVPFIAGPIWGNGNPAYRSSRLPARRRGPVRSMKRFRGTGLAILVPCAIALAAPAAAATPCGFEPQGEGRVSAVIDARSFRMEDGREVRLGGIEIVADGAASLASLVAGRDVSLRGETDAPDRYGRQPAFVFVDSGERPVQSMLLERGEALASGAVADKACAAELAAAETLARRARSGVWA